MNPYENLANAIIIQAAKDYKKALKVLKRNSRYEPALFMKCDCERYFRSAWFATLTNLNGELLMDSLKKEAA